MSERKTINKIILDNYKIDDLNNLENTQNKRLNDIKGENNDNCNSFNQLLSLQLLIQKHSGLKDLCKYYIIKILKYLFYYISYKRKR